MSDLRTLLKAELKGEVPGKQQDVLERLIDAALRSLEECGDSQMIKDSIIEEFAESFTEAEEAVDKLNDLLRAGG